MVIKGKSVIPPELVKGRIMEVLPVDAVSPKVSIEQVDGGYLVTITDIDGVHTATIPNGATGNGIASTTLNADYTLTVTYTDGSTFTSEPIRGEAGYSPVVSITEIEGGHRVTIRDLSGDHEYDVLDGEKGDSGYSPSVAVEEIYKGHRVTITDESGDHLFEVLDGTPEEVIVFGTDVTIQGKPNTRYICGEVSTIAIAPPEKGVIDVFFRSGSSAAILTLPNTVRMPDWFDILSLETNMIYEILITDGEYGSVMSWQD